MTSVAEDVVVAAIAHGLTLATAESLTGGLVCGALTDVAGASAGVRGGVVAYATDVKRDVLGVDGPLLAERGAVDADVAVAMARGASRLLHADLGIATTGVAGPTPQDGQAVGTVHVAVVGPGESVRHVRLSLAGDRSAIRAATVEAALGLALTALREHAAD